MELILPLSDLLLLDYMSKKTPNPIPFFSVAFFALI